MNLFFNFNDATNIEKQTSVLNDIINRGNVNVTTYDGKTFWINNYYKTSVRFRYKEHLSAFVNCLAGNSNSATPISENRTEFDPDEDNAFILFKAVAECDRFKIIPKLEFNGNGNYFEAQAKGPRGSIAFKLRQDDELLTLLKEKKIQH